MKASLCSTVILAVLLAILAHTQAADDQNKVAPKKEKSVSEFMRLKLKLSQDAMEGIVNEDYDLIKTSADALSKMGTQKEWNVIPLDDYSQMTAEFRRSAKSMAKEAEKSNIDGTAMAYLQLTMSCVECHKLTRRIRMADASPTAK